MGLFATIKRNSKRALKGNWGRAISLTVLIFGAVALFSILEQAAIEMFAPVRGLTPGLLPPGATPLQVFASVLQVFPLAEWIILGVFSALTMFIITPVQLGAARWFYGLVRGKKQPIAEAFYYFESGKRYGRSIWFCVNMSVRSFLWALLFFALPGGILTISSYWLSRPELPRSQAAGATIGMLIAVCLMILAAVFYTAFISRYTLAAYLLGESDEISASRAISDSVKYTKGHRFSLMWFTLSYIGWLLLCGFFFPILYVWPYFSAGIAMYAMYIIEKYRKETLAEELPAAQNTREFYAPEPEQEQATSEPEAEPELEYFSRPTPPEPIDTEDEPRDPE